MIWTHNHLSFLKIEETTENNHCGCIVFGKSSFVKPANSSVAVRYYTLQITVGHSRKRAGARLLTFSKLVTTESFLAACELDDVHNFPTNHRQIFPSQLLYGAIRIHHHGVQCPERALILGGGNASSAFFFKMPHWWHRNLFYLTCEIILP